MSPVVGSRVGLSVATGASAAALLLHRKRTAAIVRAADAHLAWAMRPDGDRVRLVSPPGAPVGGSGSTPRRRPTLPSRHEL